MMYKLSLMILLAGLAPGWTTASPAQDEKPSYDDDTRECISLRLLRRTHVADDLNILFYMRGKTVYHNILPRQCGGLARENRFSYSLTGGRLCRGDAIQVLYNDAFGMRGGPSCVLGTFHKITREDAKAYRGELKRKSETKPLPMPEPEEVGGEKGQEEQKEPESKEPESQ